MYKTILIVDDQAVIRSMLKVSLNQLGSFTILEAGNGKEAFEVASKACVDLIFCDINMPGSDGLELLQQLSSNSFQGDIVVISGEDDSLLRSAKSLLEGYNLKILDIVAKPLTFNKVRKYIESIGVKSKSFIDTCLPEIDETALAGYLSDNAVVSHFQAQYSLHDLRIVGFEALARIKSDDGYLYPSQFIGTAENSDIIVELTRQVIHSALSSFSKLVFDKYDVTLSLNISSKLLEDTGFPQWLSKTAEKYGVSNSSVICELTETTISEDPTTVHVSLLRLRMLDFKVSIDDFGTGYATLSQLHSLPFSELKIDRTFVSDLVLNKNSYSVCVKCIGLARDFGLNVVAEGVEDEATLTKLKELGCDIAQGYFLAKPISSEIAVARLNAHDCGVWE